MYMGISSRYRGIRMLLQSWPCFVAGRADYIAKSIRLPPPNADATHTQHRRSHWWFGLVVAPGILTWVQQNSSLGDRLYGRPYCKNLA